MPAYGLSKNAGTLAMQLIAKDTMPEVMQIVSFNPGPVFTPGAELAGISKGDFEFNDGESALLSSFPPCHLTIFDLWANSNGWVDDLAGHFAVWAASPEAAFLHGRFVWNEWDVDEMKSGDLRKKIDENPPYLQIGIHGI